MIYIKNKDMSELFTGDILFNLIFSLENDDGKIESMKNKDILSELDSSQISVLLDSIKNIESIEELIKDNVFSKILIEQLKKNKKIIYLKKLQVNIVIKGEGKILWFNYGKDKLEIRKNSLK